ncbi:hypothetical protein E3O06_10065 [Cryobacterium glaciale]|uniref:Uncharacterized protein n=1 Tax=Cryobacterium glaciale TaxID=1259145 RepID=A0A4R8UXK6_9MICO|nr:hypothetical protein [Cryobacterium glaciale]TFB72654.1 hypothetical protein E3O06_10065 [Cryobacterium glaciale]
MHIPYRVYAHGATGTETTSDVRPYVAAAALALLVWALHERLGSERKATRATLTGSVDGEVCTTCRPLFARPTP